MTQRKTFGRRSTADHVLAGIDLTGKHFLVTGCNSGIGFATASALAANGAHVIAAARTHQKAAETCREIGYHCSPLECDLGDLESIAAAAESVRLLQVPLDGIVANAGVANVAAARVRYGVEQHFLVNHLGHFALVNDLAGVVRDATGRIVIVTSSAAGAGGADGIMFDNLDGLRSYETSVFYAHSKFANALYAKELSRRLLSRGIAVNSVNPGRVHGMGMRDNPSLARRLGDLPPSPSGARLHKGRPALRFSSPARAQPVSRASTGRIAHRARQSPAERSRLGDAAMGNFRSPHRGASGFATAEFPEGGLSFLRAVGHFRAEGSRRAYLPRFSAANSQFSSLSSSAFT